MANAVTPNIGMELPTPGVTGALGVEAPGKSWLELLNTALWKIDQHNHTGVGGGAPVGGFSIAADLSFNSFNATGLRSTRYDNQVSDLALPADVRCIYFKSGDLYIVNGSGTPVRITNGSSVVGAAGNITGLSSPAAVTYSSGAGSFTFEKNTGVTADVITGVLSIKEEVVSGKKVSIAAPTGLAADYALTLPTGLPANTRVLTLSAAGVIAASNIADETTLTMNASGVMSVKALTAPLLPAVNMVQSGSVSWSGAPSTATDVPGLTLAITTTGRPVVVVLVPTSTGASSISLIMTSGGSNIVTGAFMINRDGSDISGHALTLNSFNTSYTSNPPMISMPPGAVFFIDSPGAGAHTYKLRANSGVIYPGTLSVYYVALLAYEL